MNAVQSIDDEPLDKIEQAFVRAMVSALLAELREAEAAARNATTEQPPSEARGK